MELEQELGAPASLSSNVDDFILHNLDFGNYDIKLPLGHAGALSSNIFQSAWG